MAGYGKLGRISDQRKALIGNQVAAPLYHGRVRTIGTRAKEIRKAVENLIAITIREKDSFEITKVTVKVVRKDKDGEKVKEVVNNKKVTVYDKVKKEIKRDLPSKLHAKGQILKVLYRATEVPAAVAGKKKNIKSIDLITKIFDNATPEYVGRSGGYTRIVKTGQRRGDGTMRVLIELA